MSREVEPATLVRNAEDTPPWSDWLAGSNEVKKIVIGTLADDASHRAELPADLARRFPALTHLHLWGIADLEHLPELPAGLLCLDVHNAPKLSEVRNLPSSLEELVIESCPGLTSLPFEKSYPALWDLSLARCTALAQTSIHAALAAAPGLRHLDLSGCPRLKHLPPLTERLERLELNHCEALTALPERLPRALRRLGLRGAKALSGLPLFESWPDYLDLAGTEGLRVLPRPGALRTLFLYGSGVLEPPASEHGSTPAENVAKRILDYYSERDLYGDGKVKRCKVLVLGNGDAGKTCLSLALVPGGDPEEAERLGSTHGVQFWPWPLQVPVGATVTEVDVQLWDFGGQEIYHQTHRLFMAKGAVFLVAWDPDQDGKSAPKKGEYQDEWRPLEYWLDFIHLACPWKPRIAIVCTKRTEATRATRERLERALQERDRDVYCFVVDSKSRAGDFESLQEWVGGAVGEVVRTQGTVVPAHWEIAQDLVTKWLAADSSKSAAASGPPRELAFGEFRSALEQEIQARIESDEAPALTRLRDAVRRRSFHLTDERVERVLQFLTNSGWVYWDPRLFERRVIVGQKWALDGIYTVLDRRESSQIHRSLIRSDGRFTLKDLDEWIWKEAGYSQAQQELLLSFMRRVGVCFQLVSGEESYWDRPVFNTFEHLPSVKDLRWRGRLPQKAMIERMLRSERLHRLHWNELLESFGDTYGTDAEYASDGFRVVNREGQEIYVFFVLESDKGIGGQIELYVTGEGAEERLEAMEAHVRAILPQGRLDMSAAPSRPEDGFGEKPARIQLFVSYAWNPGSSEESSLMGGEVPKSYEAPVDYLEARFGDPEERVEFLRDKRELGPGKSVTEFMTVVRKCDRVLVVHSDKYWRSIFCMYELTELWSSLVRRPDGLAAIVRCIELPSSRIREQAAVSEYLEHWQARTDGALPTLMQNLTSMPKLRAAAIAFFHNEIGHIYDIQGINRPWQEGSEPAIFEWVRGCLPSATPDRTESSRRRHAP